MMFSAADKQPQISKLGARQLRLRAAEGIKCLCLAASGWQNKQITVIHHSSVAPLKRSRLFPLVGGRVLHQEVTESWTTPPCEQWRLKLHDRHKKIDLKTIFWWMCILVIYLPTYSIWKRVSEASRVQVLNDTWCHNGHQLAFDRTWESRRRYKASVLSGDYKQRAKYAGFQRSVECLWQTVSK